MEHVLPRCILLEYLLMGKKSYYAYYYPTDGLLIMLDNKPLTKIQARRQHRERIRSTVREEPWLVRLGIGYGSREEQEWFNA
jgi:hypothetical protein